MNDFSQVGIAASFSGTNVISGCCHLASQLGPRPQLRGQVTTIEIRISGDLTFMNVSRSNRDFPVQQLCAGTATVGESIVAGGGHLIFDDDIDRIELVVLARYRTLEEKRAGVVIDAVIDEAAQRSGAGHHFTMEAVTGFDSDLLRIKDNAGSGESVQTGGTVSTQLFLDKRLGGFRAEGGNFEILRAEFALEAVHSAAVAGEFGKRKAGIVIAEHRIELIAFDLQVELSLAGRLVTLAGAVTIERIEAVGIDSLKEGVPGDTGPLFGAVIGHGKEPFPFYRSFRKEGDTLLVVKVFIRTGRLQIFHVAGEGVVPHGTFGDTDQNPVAVVRCEAGTYHLRFT